MSHIGNPSPAVLKILSEIPDFLSPADKREYREWQRRLAAVPPNPISGSLLAKYIAHVIVCEGVNYIESPYSYALVERFTEEERQTLLLAVEQADAFNEQWHQELVAEESGSDA